MATRVDLGTGAPAASGERGVVATSNPLATQIGLEILKRGGNAVDSAVAASFALGVVEPFMSGIGGGCFVMTYDAATGDVSALNARGVAPAAATEDMFVRNGQVQAEETAVGHRSVLVPGLIAGLTVTHGAKGRIPLAELVEPGARLAEEGYAVSPMFTYKVRNTAHTVAALRRYPEAARIYLESNGEPRATGARVRNPDLARTYRTIGTGGAEAFYRGEIAEAIVREMRAGGGLITADDLASYHPTRLMPVAVDYHGHTVCSIAPPSSGGIFLVHCLQMLAGLHLGARARYETATLHLLAEVMKRAYADRAHFVGDPAFVDVPLAALTGADYAAARLQEIDPERASAGVGPGEPARFGRIESTTHLCVADEAGNVVVITQTVGNAMGSGVVVPGTGILLNHLMGDFSPAVGAQTAHGWGTFTSRANAIAPGKTPTSSNSPAIVLRDGKPVLATGAAGGSRIPSAVLQILLNVVDFGMDVQQAISAARIHDQGEGLEIEREVPERVRRELAAMGHKVSTPDDYLSAMSNYAQGVAIDHERGLFTGGADPRDEGLALAL